MLKRYAKCWKPGMELSIDILMGAGQEIEDGVQCGYFIPKDEKKLTDAEGDNTSDNSESRLIALIFSAGTGHAF